MRTKQGPWPTIMHTIHAKACGYLGWLNILVKQDRDEMELNLLHAGLSPHCFLSICYFAVVTETKKGRVAAKGHVSIGRSPWSLGPPHLNYWATLSIYTASRHRETISISLNPPHHPEKWEAGTRDAAEKDENRKVNTPFVIKEWVFMTDVSVNFFWKKWCFKLFFSIV